MVVRRCEKCGKRKAHVAHGVCRKCYDAAYDPAYYQRHREQRLAYQRAYYQRKKKERAS